MYKYIMFEMLPYGATITVNCTSSSKQGVTNNEIKQIGKDNCYFLESVKEPVEMTFSYAKKNGILVEIITNLEVITNNNIKKISDGHYSIVNSNWLSTGNGSFTISNTTWFNNGKQEDPYIKLCFNKVRVECCFTNPWNKWGNVPLRGENGWKGLKNDTDIDKLRPTTFDGQNYCTLAKYITVSWNQSENNGNLLKGQYRNDTHWYQGWFAYGDKDGNIRSFDYRNPNNDESQRLWSTVSNDAFNLTVPKLNGTDSINNITVYDYFKIGYTINLSGESSWQNASTLETTGEYYAYDSEGFYNKETLSSVILNSTNGSPNIYTHPANSIWSTKSKFYLTNNGKYLSPANGVEINSIWTTQDICVPYVICECDCNCNCQCNCNCECQCDCEWSYCNSWCHTCNCNCNNCNCQCNNCNCQHSGSCQCQSGNCEGCDCNSSCDCQCQCQCDGSCQCDGGGEITIDYWGVIYGNTYIRTGPGTDYSVRDTVPSNISSVTAHFSKKQQDGSGYYWYYADSVDIYAEGWVRQDRVG